MTFGRFIGVLLTFAFPGVGQGLAGRRPRMLAWVVGTPVVLLAVILSIWIVPVTLLVRLAAAVDAYRCLRDGPERPSYRLAALAVVGGVLGAVGVRQLVEGFRIPSSSMSPTLVIGDHIMVDKLSTHWHAPARGEVYVFEQPCAHITFVKRIVAVGGDTVELRCGRLHVNGTALPATLVSASTTYQERDESAGRWSPRSVSRHREVLGGHGYDIFHTETLGTLRDFPVIGHPFAPSCAQSDFYPDQPASDVPVGQLVATKANGAEPCELQLHYVVPAGTYFMLGDNRDNANDSRVWGVVPAHALIGRPIGIWYSNGADGGWGRFGSID